MRLPVLLAEATAVARGLRRRPAVPALLASVVAVGVAFLVTAFGVFDALLWRDLAYGPRSDFMLVGELRADQGLPPVPRLRVDTYLGYREAHARGRLPAVAGLVPVEERTTNLVVDGVASRETASWLLPDAFALLRAAPIIGRAPADPDGRARLAREVAIGEALWARRFARSPDVLGRPVTVDGEAAVIVGVLPAAFQFHRMSQLWVARSPRELAADADGEVVLAVRVAGGATREQVLDQLDPVRLAVRAARVPVDSTSRGALSWGIFGRDLVPDMLARMIIATVLLVLVAACLNIATLFLARLRRRLPDYATRQAIGAGRAGVVRHLLLEIALIVAAGGLAAAAAAWWLVGAIRAAASGILPLWAELHLDARAFAVTLAALAAALAIVALPAVRLLRRLDLARLLVHRGTLGGAPKHGRGASALIATQVAVVVILAAATLPIAVSAVNLADVRSGLDDDRVVELSATLVGSGYAEDAARDAFASRAAERLAADPRVEAVARVGALGAWRTGATVWSDSILTDAGPEPVTGARRRNVAPDVVSDDYFRVVGLELVDGRGFDDAVHAGGERVAVLSREAAARLWPGARAVGRTFRIGTEGPWTRVIGVVADEINVWGNWDGTTVGPDPRYYVSDRQASPQLMTFRLRARQVTPELLRDVRAVLEGVDPTQSVGRVELLADQFARHRGERMWIAIILGSGALVTVLLAMTGVFGLVSYYTTARLPELALRTALGAPMRAVVWLVARGTLRSVAIGVACGALALAVVQDGIRRFTYETSTTDPTVLLLIALLVLPVAGAALAVPLRRLRRLSPQEVLRTE